MNQKITCWVTLFSVILFAPSVLASECHPPTNPQNMTLTFDDEFKGGKLNTKQWNIHTRDAGTVNNAEAQAYVPYAYEMLPNGGIRLRADKGDINNKHFTSAEITTTGGFSQTYGHFEMKAKVPAVNGAWPAFWLLSENGGWPPEIDILEYIYQPWGKPITDNNPSYAHFNVFWPPNSPTVTWKTPDNAPWNSNSEVYLTDNYHRQAEHPPVFDADLTNDYHVYALDWRPAELSFLIDGVERFCWVEGADTIGSVPRVPMYMVANLALSKAAPDPAGWAGQIQPGQTFPITMDIAYIKAYQFKDAPKTKSLPLVIGIPVLSSESVNPGDTLSISTNLKAGDDELTSVDTVVSINSFDGKQNFRKMDFGFPSTIAAHDKLPVLVHFVVPGNMQPGLYTVGIRTEWRGGSDEVTSAAVFKVK